MPTKVHIVKAMVFPVVTYGCKSWTIKKAEHWRADAFELCWKRLLRVPWTAKISNQSILKEINPECSLEGLMLKLKLQYFGYLMQRENSLEKTLMLGKIEGRRRRGWQRMRWLDGIINSMGMSLINSGSCWWTGRPDVLQSMGVAKSHTWLRDWTDWCPIFLHLERISRKELDHHSKKWSDSYRRNMVMKEIQLYLYVLRLQITIPETLSPICFSWICVSSSSDITG